MKTRKITYTGLFAALGILLPMAFHIVGGPGIGSILLPMHIPVMVGAMFLGPFSGLFIAMISVVVGALMGMPPMPIAIFMFFELSTYGLVAGYLHHERGANVYLTLIGAMISGRLVNLAVINLFLLMFDAKLSPVFGTLAMFALSIPGMILQLVLIPILVMTLKRVIIPAEARYE